MESWNTVRRARFLDDGTKTTGFSWVFCTVFDMVFLGLLKIPLNQINHWRYDFDHLASCLQPCKHGNRWWMVSGDVVLFSLWGSRTWFPFQSRPESWTSTPFSKSRTQYEFYTMSTIWWIGDPIFRCRLVAVDGFKGLPQNKTLVCCSIFNRSAPSIDRR